MKSKFVKIAALVLVAVLATSCVLANTLAYYKTQTDAQTITAGIAKWNWEGISVTSSALLFDGKIAPGMAGSSAFKVKDYPQAAKAPEVDYEYGWIVEIDSASIDNLKFGLSKNEVNSSAEELIEAIEDDYCYFGDANELPAEDNMTLEIYWRWDDNGQENAYDSSWDSKTVSVTVKFYAKQNTVGGGVV